MAHNIFCHSQNDNQTHRLVHTIVNGQPVTQKFEMGCDVENRLVSVTGGNGTTFSVHFTYNGDGQRVKSVVNGETILFIGGHYELNSTTGEVSRYYFAGASRIAVRKYIVPQTTSLTYLVGDHLGSTSLAVDASTGDVIETRYREASRRDKPWGEVRFTTGNKTLPTRYTFTGQYSYVSDDATDLGNAGFGLMFYNARWYDPAIGRFVSADTIVPGGVQGLDRYAYVNNSPVNYVDPMGHFTVEAIQGYIGGMCAQKYDIETEEGQQAYSTCYFQTLAAWQADTDWWDMLIHAREGDILIVRSFGELQYYQFSGKGTTGLIGITPYGPSEGDLIANTTLSEIQSGIDTDCTWCNSPKPRFGWYGFIRFDDKHMPYFWLRSGVSVTQRKDFKGWARWGIDATLAGFFFRTCIA